MHYALVIGYLWVYWAYWELWVQTSDIRHLTSAILHLYRYSSLLVEEARTDEEEGCQQGDDGGYEGDDDYHHLVADGCGW